MFFHNFLYSLKAKLKSNPKTIGKAKDQNIKGLFLNKTFKEYKKL